MKSVPQTPKRAVLYARVSTEAQATDDKTSLSEQLLALRKYADSHGYKVVEEIPEEISGRKQDTEGLERIRDLADSGEIDAVLVHKWNRLARTVARFETLMLEMKLAGVQVISLDGQSNETASGRMFNRLMAVFSEYQRDDLIATMQQGKVGRARTRGKVVPGRYAPYGFTYDKEAGNYRVDEERMRHVRRLFRMVGSEGATLRAVKSTFQREGVPTPGGGHYWHTGTIREMIRNDVYKAHERDEFERLTESGNLSPEVLARLDRNRRYGIAWYNRTRWERNVHGEKAIRVTPNEREDWVAVPVPDAGISREWVDAARAAIKDNVRQSRVDGRSWELKGILFCPCGCRMAPYNSRRGGKRYHYYACSRYRREGPSACEHHKNWPAEALEQAARQFVLELIRDPETLREQVEAEVAREKAALRDTRKQVAALAHRLAEADAERDRYNRLYARGKLSDDEYDAYTAETAERKKTAEEELARLEDARRNVEYLDELPRLVEDYLKELPEMLDYMPRIREYVVKDEHKSKHLDPRPVVPGMHRKRMPEEMEQLRQDAERERAERYQYMYAKLGLKAIAYRDGTLEFIWKAGKSVSKLCVSPRCRAAETIFSSSTPTR